MGPPFEALVTCSLAHLSAKVFILLAITSARRVSELQALMRPLYTIFFKDKVFMRLHPKCIPKMVFSIHLRQSTFFPKLHAHKDEKRLHTLDIHYTHSLYIARTKSFRLAPCLFIYILGRQDERTGGVSSKMVSLNNLRYNYKLWDNKHTISCKNVSSFYKGSSNFTFLRHLPAEDICRAVIWSSVYTFSKDCTITIVSRADLNFEKAVLQSLFK